MPSYKLVILQGVTTDEDGFVVTEGEVVRELHTFEAEYPAAVRMQQTDLVRIVQADRTMLVDGYINVGVIAWRLRGSSLVASVLPADAPLWDALES